MIKFEYEDGKDGNRPTFGMVEYDQFFIDVDGWLCQRVSYDAYITIADSDGDPLASLSSRFDGDSNIDDDMPISKILPKVKKIRWE